MAAYRRSFSRSSERGSSPNPTRSSERERRRAPSNSRAGCASCWHRSHTKLQHGVSPVNGLRCPLSNQVPRSVERPQTQHCVLARHFIKLLIDIFQLKNAHLAAAAPRRAGRTGTHDGSHPNGHSFYLCAATSKCEPCFALDELRANVRSNLPHFPISCELPETNFRSAALQNDTPTDKPELPMRFSLSRTPTPPLIASRPPQQPVSGLHRVCTGRLERAACSRFAWSLLPTADSDSDAGSFSTHSTSFSL